MKNYLQNRNNNLERTSLFDAIDDFFRPVFADEADYRRLNRFFTKSFLIFCGV